MIAVGLGCRSGCTHEDIVLAITTALVQANRALVEVQALYVPTCRAAEPGVRAAAAQLEKPLHELSLAALEAQAPFALTSSARVLRACGVPSVAETAALAGASGLGGEGAVAKLLGARLAVGGATCALALLQPLGAV